MGITIPLRTFTAVVPLYEPHPGFYKSAPLPNNDLKEWPPQMQDEVAEAWRVTEERHNLKLDMAFCHCAKDSKGWFVKIGLIEHQDPTIKVGDHELKYNEDLVKRYINHGDD